MAGWLEVLSRCGLAEAAVLVTPARSLSAGQVYRLALARALWQGRQRGRPTLIVADEFAANLDDDTAIALAGQIRKWVRQENLGLLVATPRPDVLLKHLQPDRVVIKPLSRPGWIVRPHFSSRQIGNVSPCRWPVTAGTIRDYHALADFHYLTGPPAAHKRVYVIRHPRPSPAAMVLGDGARRGGRAGDLPTAHRRPRARRGHRGTLWRRGPSEAKGTKRIGQAERGGGVHLARRCASDVPFLRPGRAAGAPRAEDQPGGGGGGAGRDGTGAPVLRVGRHDELVRRRVGYVRLLRPCGRRPVRSIQAVVPVAAASGRVTAPAPFKGATPSRGRRQIFRRFFA